MPSHVGAGFYFFSDSSAWHLKKNLGIFKGESTAHGRLILV
jgi:hypothetical protein